MYPELPTSFMEISILSTSSIENPLQNEFTCLDIFFQHIKKYLWVRGNFVISHTIHIFHSNLIERLLLCILPTSYGKSLIFQLLPAVCRELPGYPSKPTIIVVSPLVSLINDQVTAANNMSGLGLMATSLDIKKYDDIIAGKYNILFGTPESWIQNKRWRELLASKYFVKNVICLVIDEVHKVSWYVKLPSYS